MISKEISKKDALNFLIANSTAVLATSHTNIPFASTIYYFVDKDLNFFFLTKANASKYLNISQNANVAIVVGTGPKHISVQASGKADFVFDEKRAEIILEFMNLMERNFVKEWPIKDMEKFKDRSTVVFKVTPEFLQFMNLDDEKYPDSISTEYHQIIPR